MRRELRRTGTATTANGTNLHPDDIVADPFVVFEDGRYRMWLTTVDWSEGTVFDATDRRMGTGYAESPDGLTWDDRHLRSARPGHRAELVLAPGAWDAEGVETVSLARDAGGSWSLFYTGDYPDGAHAIGFARGADDGLHWEREEAPVFVPESPWEQPVCTDPPGCTAKIGGVLEPSFLVDPDTGTQHLWYAAVHVPTADFTMSIGHASRQGEAPWVRAPGPVFDAGPVGAWDEVLVSHTHVIADPGGGYHLFYQGLSAAQNAQCKQEGSCPFYTPGSIGHAFSDDGLTWIRDPEPLLVPDEAAGEGFFVGGPSALVRGDKLELFYFGIASRDDATFLRAHIGKAVADCAP
ncbi:Laminin G, sub domain 2 [Chondromyces apiculatus DSM 436]|uniref:Laminin G, sub domain 2 n=1 Tax=Chondromyces apiculatus DSM 436 TaxID=1192034 RepID=A0A017TJ13_9BACT|nr:Laminin G, sub domain 2 [Chondromyces apiculatus DSM 436]